MAMDSIRRFFEHLKHITSPKEQTKIDLFLSSNGGDGVVPWRLVTLIREYCSEFNVIIPYNAFSAATLTCLGANNIIMLPTGMLGPTDPSIMNPYGPNDPSTNQKLSINVEDVMAYRDLIKEDFLDFLNRKGEKIDDEIMLDAVKFLAGDKERVHPLALGAVKRSHSQAKMLAEKLLRLHVPQEKEADMKKLIDNLTSKLFYHGHPINRNEARNLGLQVIDCGDEADLVWELFNLYEQEMNMLELFNPIAEFNDRKPNFDIGANGAPVSGKIEIKNLKMAFIESEYGSHHVETGYKVEGFKFIQQQTNKIIEEFNISPLKGGWVFTPAPTKAK